MDLFCRLCMKESHSFMDIFGGVRFENSVIFEVINDVYNLQIQMDDKLPKHICEECSLKLREFKEWKSNALKVKLKLMEMLRQIESVQIKQEKEDIESSDEDGFLEEVVVKREVEDHTTNDEDDNSSTNKEPDFHTEFIIKEEKEEDDENNALNIEIKKYISRGETEAKGSNDIIIYIPTMLGPDGMVKEGIGEIISSAIVGNELVLGNSAKAPFRRGRKKKDNRYKCSCCDKEFGYPSLLEQHMLVHTGVRPHRCNRCSKEFTSKGNLKTHLLTHTREKAYSCFICKKKFSLKGNLVVHYRTHRRQQHRYECAQCDETFAVKADLLTHEAVHLMEEQS